jgi:hypothetical protein
VKRLATFEWRSPPPNSADETMAIYDDGSAWLVVRSPRTPPRAIGTFVAKPTANDLAALTAAGPGPVMFSAVGGAPDRASAELRVTADRVASAAREKPRAIATFQAGPVAPVAGGMLAMALLVDGGGKQAVELELEPRKCTIHLARDGMSVGSMSMPELGSGFVTPEGEGLGGLRRRATIKPRVFGATAFQVPAPADATHVAIDVHGWLAEALPDERAPAPFAVRTMNAPILR